MSSRTLPLLLAVAFGLPGAQADPMRPLATVAAAASAPVNVPRQPIAAASSEPALPPLVAIRESNGGSRQALIGQQWLAAGERVAGHRVLAVHATRVDLGRGKTRQTLHLLPPLLESNAADAPAPSPPARSRALRVAQVPPVAAGVAEASPERATARPTP